MYGTVNEIFFMYDDSVGTMMSPDMQPKREFSAKYQPENCKEVEMISYLMDCYDRAGLEERLAPKVGGQLHKDNQCRIKIEVTIFS